MTQINWNYTMGLQHRSATTLNKWITMIISLKCNIFRGSPESHHSCGGPKSFSHATKTAQVMWQRQCVLTCPQNSPDPYLIKHPEEVLKKSITIHRDLVLTSWDRPLWAVTVVSRTRMLAAVQLSPVGCNVGPAFIRLAWPIKLGSGEFGGPVGPLSSFQSSGAGRIVLLWRPLPLGSAVGTDCWHFLKQCLCGSKNNHVNARTQGFPLEHCTAVR